MEKTKQSSSEFFQSLLQKLNKCYDKQEQLIYELDLLEDDIRLLQEMLYHQSRRQNK